METESFNLTIVKKIEFPLKFFNMKVRVLVKD